MVKHKILFYKYLLLKLRVTDNIANPLQKSNEFIHLPIKKKLTDTLIVNI